MQHLLPPAVAVRLGELCQRIETLCGSPQDIEWAWDGTQCWIVQSRPITTLASSTTTTAETVWTNANMKDVPGLVSPFTWSLMRPQLEGDTRPIPQMGFHVPPECRLFGVSGAGSISTCRCFSKRPIPCMARRLTSRSCSWVGRQCRFYRPGSPSRWQRLRWLGNALPLGAWPTACARPHQPALLPVEQHWRELLSQIPHLDRAGLLQQLDTFSSVTQSFLLQHLYLTTAMSGNFSHLRDLLARLEASTSSGLVAELMTGLGDVSSAEQSYRLWELSRLAQQVTPGDGISPHQTVAHLAGGAGRYTVPVRLAGVPGHLRASLSLRSGDGQPAGVSTRLSL